MPLLFSAAAQSWLTIQNFRRSAAEGLSNRALSVGHLMASRLGPSIDFDDRPDVEESLDALARADDFAFAVVWDARGRELSGRGPDAVRKAWRAGPRVMEAVRLDIDGVVGVEVPIAARGRDVGKLALGFRTGRAWDDAWRQGSMSVLVDLAGAAVSLVVVLVLVRAIAQRSAEVQRSLERLRITGSLARVGGFEFRPDTRCFRWSREAQVLLGLGERRLSTMEEFLALLDPDSRKPCAEQLAACIERGATFELEVRRSSAQRNGAWLRVQGRQERETRAEVYVSGAVQDVTAQRQARDAALEASRLKSQFLANVSHEIRTPLNGILGVAELARGLGPQGAMAEYLDVMDSSGKHMLEVVNDLLDFSRIEAGRVEIEDRGFSLSELVTSAVAGLTATATLKQLTLETHVAPELADRRRGDPLRLKQVITNLLGNAIKFTERGGVRLEAHPGTREGWVDVVVSDTGIGIPPDRLGSIFDAFVQADGTTSRRFGGSGLGLTISRDLLTLMGGFLEVESAVGRGSTFTMSLPLRVEQHVASKPVLAIPAANGPESSLRVLLAEDNRVNALVATRMLERLGHRVHQVGDGAAAVEAARGGGYDVILMDVQMPVLDGLEATRMIRAREAQSDLHVPILALTANAARSDEVACLASGMDGFLSKPLELESLGRALRRHACGDVRWAG